MKFTCPICETASDISKDHLAHPVTRTTCRNCSTILLINPETGKVDAHKSPLKDSPAIEAAGSPSADKGEAVLSAPSQDRDARDWTAIVVVTVIFLVLISIGVFFAIKLDTF
ncbi:MAG: hypothetical protein PVH28_13345 [Desulfobacterales bacterium]